MKKYLYQIFVLILAITSLTFVSCSDGDDDEISSSNIVGTWENDSFSTDEAETFFGKQYVQFNANGEFIEIDVDGYGSEGDVDITRGQWKKEGNTISISGKGVTPVTTQITNLTNTDLTLVTLGISLSYKRVDDSIIDKYLN